MVEAEAAEFLRLATGTLQNKRVSGDGPPFLKLGAKVVYKRDDLLAWAEGLRRTSTSDTGRAGGRRGRKALRGEVA
jgi:hypothetical protein